MRRPDSTRSGFSLVETLVVLTVASILAVLTVGSFSALRATSLAATGNQMVDVMAMARQNSISKNAYTAVVIKSQGPGACSAYCLLELTRQDDGSFGNWAALTTWKYLPQGVVFETGKSVDTFSSSSTASNLPQVLPATYPFQGQSVDLSTVSFYQCYQPDGTLVGNHSAPVRLRLVSGKADPASGAITYLGQVNYYDLVFVSNTGVTMIERP
jgi:prepilin-type N-terminal cleavage/methylation domain-containing protein